MNQDFVVDRTSQPIAPPRRVLVGPYGVFNWLYKPLMTLMRERWGTKFIVLLPENSERKVEYDQICGPDTTYIYYSDFLTMAARQAHRGSQEVFATARANEEKYNVCYTMDIYQQERPIARGLVASPARSLFREKSAPDSLTLARAANGFFEFYENIFETHDIDLVLVWPRTAAEAACVAIAETRGIVVTYPATAKHKHYAFWASGAYSDNRQHRLAYEEIGECDPLAETDIPVPARPAYLEQGQIDRRMSVIGSIQRTSRLLLEHLDFLLVDIKKGKVRGSRWANSLNTLRSIWGDFFYYRKFVRLCERDFKKLTERPFVFYAFHMEPEFATQARCKEFNDQGAIVRQLALSLPAGMNLVIKEHAMIGGHRLTFYSDLVDLPNVMMAHPGFKAIELIQRATVTVTLSGTVSLEAALFGKPALVFNERSESAILPSVQVVHRLDELADIIRNIKPYTPEQTVAVKRAAARLLKATEAIGIEARPFFTKEEIEVKPSEIERAADLLLRLIRTHAPKTYAAAAE